MLAFTCNVCGARSITPRAKLDRETPSCSTCASSLRYRSLVHVLSTSLFGESLPLPAFPSRPDVVGLGLSDWLPSAERLATRLGYRNTFFLHEPRLDIADPPRELAGTLDFLISSEVLEHVAPPVERAFAGCFSLLKPGGLLLLTVPYSREGETIEHFPDLHEYEVVDFHGSWILVNRTAGGSWEVHDGVVLHEGIGETLEMRWFTLPGLNRSLREAGFVDVVERSDEAPGYGLLYPQPCPVPIVARRPL